MEDAFLSTVSDRLARKGYLVERSPSIPGLRALLYAHSPAPVRMAFARVYDHFVFVDWADDLFGRLDMLLEAHKKFSAFVNTGFKVPRAWRMTIPNLVTIAVSSNEFPQDVIDYIGSHYLNPWIGGETGQLMLVRLPEGHLYHHDRPDRMSRQTGSIPLVTSVGVLKEVILG